MAKSQRTVKPDLYAALHEPLLLQWNLSVTTTSIMKFITCDLLSNVF